jgi:hypothetical protein
MPGLEMVLSDVRHQFASAGSLAYALWTASFRDHSFEASSDGWDELCHSHSIQWLLESQARNLAGPRLRLRGPGRCRQEAWPNHH